MKSYKWYMMIGFIHEKYGSMLLTIYPLLSFKCIRGRDWIDQENTTQVITNWEPRFQIVIPSLLNRQLLKIMQVYCIPVSPLPRTKEFGIGNTQTIQ
jgi:hypothetical protein